MNAPADSNIAPIDAMGISLIESYPNRSSAEAQTFFRSRLQDIHEPCAPFGILDEKGEGMRRRARYRLDAEFKLRAVLYAERTATSISGVIHAAWALVLARLSGQNPIVYGTRSASFSLPAHVTEGFAGMLPLALRMDSDTTAERLVEQVNRELADLQRFKQSSIELALSCSGVAGGAPLFTSTFCCGDRDADRGEEWALNQDTKEPRCGTDSAKFVLQLFVACEGDAIEVTARSSQSIVPERIISYLETALRSLLDALERSPEASIHSLNILPDRERRELTESFNDTYVDYSPDRLVHELFEAQVERTPEALALIYADRAFTFAELNGMANEVASWLRSSGVAPDQLVGLYFERTPAMVISAIAVLKAGGAYLPLDPHYPHDRLQYMVADASPIVILTQPSLQQSVPQTSGQVIAIDTSSLQPGAGSVRNVGCSEFGQRADHLVYVIYTSGSTGRPKGIAMPHHAVANLIEWHRTTFGDGRGVRVLQFAAMSFDVAFQEIFTTLCTGGTLVLLDEWVRRDPGALLELMNKACIGRLFVPPLLLQNLAEHCVVSGTIPSALQDVIVAGEQLRVGAETVELFGRLGARLHNHYGPTETHVVTALTCTPPANAWPTLPSIGSPLANTQIYILDERYEPVPLGATGEIYIGGANVARGYLNQPELTAERFRPDPFASERHARMYKTGDVGRWSPDGTIEYLGRNDDQVKIRGFRIELGEIEALLARHEQVKEVAVVARELDSGNKGLVAYVTPRRTTSLDSQALRSFLRSALPEHMIPSAFVVLDKMPTTPSGKLDRRALPACMLSESREHSDTPLGEIEQALAAAWQDVLRVRAVGRQDHFFELGGDSLSAMQVLVKLAKRFRVPLQAHIIFRDPTLRAMAQAVEARVSGQRGGTIVTIPLQSHLDVRSAPLTAMQHQWWTYIRDQQQGFSERLCYIAMKISGALNCERLKFSLNQVMARHSVLRTRIVVRNGIPEQHIDPAADCDFEFVDLSYLPGSDATREVLHFAQQFVTAKVSLSEGPLFAAKSFRLSADEHVFIMALEHVITDGSSMTILHQDLWTIYQQAEERVPLLVSKLPLQFADYAIWQERMFASWTQEHEAYWRAYLDRAPTIKLPLHESATHDGGAAYSIAKIEFGAELTADLQELTRRSRTILALTTFAVYVAAMARWCEQRDVTVIFVSNARLQPELENIVGFLTNHLYLRLRILDGDTCASLLSRLNQELSAAYEHNDLDRVPLLFPQCTTELYFNWESASWTPGTLDLWPHSHRSLHIEPFALEVPWRRRFVPIFHETDGGIVVAVHHRCDLLRPASVKQFGDLLITVARQFVSNPDGRVIEFKLD